jgi:acyl-CoA synthetase (AMP-forming)/AMP-acid ligase II
VSAPDPFDQPHIDPDRIAIVTDAGESVNYREFALRAHRLAGSLRARGLEVGDAVAVLSENSPHYLEMTWACRLAGLYYVTVNSHLSVDEIAYIVNDSGSVAILASSKVAAFSGLTAEVVPAIRHRILRGGASDGWDDYETAIVTGPVYVSDTELEGDILQYSSGTTGRPKGIKRALRPAPKSPAEDLVCGLTSLIGTDSNSVFMTPAPLYHTAPIMWTMAVLRLGATVVLMTKFDAECCLALIEKHGVTHGQFVPTMFVRMLKLPAAVRERFDMSSLRGVVHAAAPCPVEIKRAMIDWWGPVVVEYYAATEGGGATIFADEWLRKPGSVGKAWSYSVIKILDESGNEVPANQPGLVYMQMGGSTFAYHKAEEKTRESRVGDLFTVGDIGLLDDDGYLFLMDRKNDMIISGGVNIYPAEIEGELVMHPAVADVAVFGVPDDEWGEAIKAVIQPVPGVVGSPELTGEILGWAAERLAKYKLPKVVDYIDELPRDDNGKLYKRKLRDPEWSGREKAI